MVLRATLTTWPIFQPLHHFASVAAFQVCFSDMQTGVKVGCTIFGPDKQGLVTLCKSPGAAYERVRCPCTGSPGRRGASIDSRGGGKCQYHT